MLDPVLSKNLAQIRYNEMLQEARNTRRFSRSVVINTAGLMSRIGTLLVAVGEKMKTQQRPIVKKVA